MSSIDRPPPPQKDVTNSTMKGPKPTQEIGKPDELEQSKIETIHLPHELDKAITQILDTRDPLDYSEFDPIEVINLFFPNGKKEMA